MKNLICTTSVFSVGCTFLEWSINYLAGKTKYLNRKKGLIDLVKNPVDKINAHGHQKNHPSGFEETQDFTNFLQQHSDFVTMYPFLMHSDIAAQKLGLDILNINQAQWSDITNFRTQDFEEMLGWLSNRDAKIIFVSLSQDLAVYHSSNLRYTDRLFYKPKKIESVDEFRQAKDLVFFKDSCSRWNDLNLTDIWDTRERLALSTRPLELSGNQINLSMTHYWLDSRELWHNGVNKIKDIMSWLEIPVDHTRVDHWQQVYTKWQRVQLDCLEFQYQYKHIVEAIINGWSYPINLTFDQEVVIQHCLIYQHNLNLKTWQLEKFPNNTSELHKLLEPNIHLLNSN
jgi:hypothetical protein